MIDLNGQNCLAEMVFEGKPNLNALRGVFNLFMPANFSYPLKLGNHKIISKVEAQQAVGGNFPVNEDAHASLAVIKSHGLLGKMSNYGAY